MNNNKIKIVYAGYSINTFNVLLKSGDIDLIGVLKINFRQFRTYNPINYIFILLYYFRARSCPVAEGLIFFVWNLFFKYFSTGAFKKYSQYLKSLYENKISVIEAERNQSLIDVSQLLVVDTWEMLPEAVIKRPKFGAINIHPSKLPQYAGALPTLWSLKNNDKTSSVTYFLMSEKMDDGKILKQHDFVIDSEDNYLSMEHKIKEIVQNTLVSDLLGYASGEILVTKSDINSRTVTERYEKYKRVIFNQEKIADIYNKVNLYPHLIPGEYCYFFNKNRKIFLYSMDYEYLNNKHRGVLIKNICCMDGTIGLRLFKDVSFINSIFLIFNL